MQSLGDAHTAAASRQLACYIEFCDGASCFAVNVTSFIGSTGPLKQLLDSGYQVQVSIEKLYMLLTQGTEARCNLRWRYKVT